MFKIEDGRESFYQWDIDRKLIINDSSIAQVHFCNKTDDCSLVVEVKDGLADVPNELLQSDWSIRVYAYDGKHTKHSATFKVISRTKPADYIYTPTELITCEKLVGIAIEDARANGEFKPSEEDMAEFMAEVDAVKEEVEEINIDLAKHESALGFLSNKVVETWADVQEIVQMGLAPVVFSVGDEFTCSHSVYGDLVWRVIGFDNEVLPKGEIKPSMTIQMVSATSAIISEFEPKEALYVYSETMPAGTYYFTLPLEYYAESAKGSAYEQLNFPFTSKADATISEIAPVGQLRIEMVIPNRSMPSLRVKAYGSNIPATNERTAIWSINGTSAKAIDVAISGTNLTDTMNPNLDKVFYQGTNRWANCTLKKWLNSNSYDYFGWYVYDGNDYATPPLLSMDGGFLCGLDSELVAVIKPVMKRTKKNTVDFDGSIEETKETIFLLSASEVGLSNEDEGTVYEYYKDSAGEGMLRSCDISSNGKLYRDGAVFPACVIY